MKLEIDIPKHQYNNIMALDSINLGRVPYKGIIMYAINAIKRGRVLEQEPILDKIKKVVAKWKANDFIASDGFAWDCMQDIADIIDKMVIEEAADEQK